MIIPEACATDNREYITKSKAMRASSGISPGFRPWTQKSPAPLLRGLPDSSPRMQDVLDVSWASRKYRDRTFPWVVDVSQCISRKLWGPVCPCLTTRSCIYDFEVDGVWPVEGKFVAMGWPTEVDFSCVTESEKQDLIGEGMFGPNVACLVLAFFLNPHGPWWSPARNAERQAASSS